MFLTKVSGSTDWIEFTRNKHQIYLFDRSSTSSDIALGNKIVLSCGIKWPLRECRFKSPSKRIYNVVSGKNLDDRYVRLSEVGYRFIKQLLSMPFLPSMIEPLTKARSVPLSLKVYRKRILEHGSMNDNSWLPFDI